MNALGDWIILDPGRMYVIPEKDFDGNPIKMIGVKIGSCRGGFMQDRTVLFNNTEHRASIAWIAAYGLDNEKPEWFKEMVYQRMHDCTDEMEWYKWTEIG